MPVGSYISRHSGNVLAGSAAGVAFHAVHYGAVAVTGLAIGMTPVFNVAVSAACLGASYFSWHQFMGGHHHAAKDKWSSFAVQAGLTIAIAFGAQHLFTHDHMSDDKMQWFQSLPTDLREQMIADTRRTYDRLPPYLRDRLDGAAAQENIAPEIFIIICDGTNPVSQEITAYLSSDKTPTPDFIPQAP